MWLLINSSSKIVLGRLFLSRFPNFSHLRYEPSSICVWKQSSFIHLKTKQLLTLFDQKSVNWFTEAFGIPTSNYQIPNFSRTLFHNCENLVIAILRWKINCGYFNWLEMHMFNLRVIFPQSNLRKPFNLNLTETHLAFRKPPRRIFWTFRPPSPLRSPSCRLCRFTFSQWN